MFNLKETFEIRKGGELIASLKTMKDAEQKFIEILKQAPPQDLGLYRFECGFYDGDKLMCTLVADGKEYEWALKEN